MKLFDVLFRIADVALPAYTVPVETDNEFEHVPWDYLAWGRTPMIRIDIPEQVIQVAMTALKFLRPSADDDRMAGYIDRFLNDPVPGNLLVFIRYDIQEEKLRGKKYDQMPMRF